MQKIANFKLILLVYALFMIVLKYIRVKASS